MDASHLQPLDDSDDARSLLLVRFFAGELTNEELRSLNALLDASPEARRQFHDISHQMLVMHDWDPTALDQTDNPAQPPLPATLSLQPPASKPPARSPRTSRRWWLAAAGLFAAVLLGSLAWRGDRPLAFGTVTSLSSAQWHGAMFAAGDRIGRGRLTLGEGLAELSLDNGVRLVLAAPVDLEFVSPMSLVVRAGSVTARVPAAVIGFTVNTAAATIVGPGADARASQRDEFGVQVGYRGETLVQVFEGSVGAKDRTGAVAEEVAAGKAVEFDAAYPVARPQRFRAERFTRQFPDPATLAPAVRNTPYNLQEARQVEVRPAPTVMEIDGKLSEWQGQAIRCRSIEPYHETYGFQGWMMYDARNLYLAAHVSDPYPLSSQAAPDADQPWRGGAVQVRLVADRRYPWPYDAEQPKYREQTHQAVQQQDTAERFAHLILWYSNPAERPCLHLAYGMDLHGDQVNPDGFLAAFQKDPDGRGYALEYAIPWSLLGAGENPPRPGDVLGTTWQVQFANQHGQWQGHLMDVFHETERGWPFQRAATWGKAVYQGPQPSPEKSR